MAFSLNKVMLLGRIGKDPETRFTTNNVEVTTFSVATDHSYKGKDGQWVNETDWHNIVAFSLSDYNKQYIAKGKRIYLEGRVRTRSYEDKDGNKRYVTEILADPFSIIPIDAQSGSGSYQTPSNQAAMSQEPRVEINEGNPEDDLPF